jgi:hypothetical protein
MFIFHDEVSGLFTTISVEQITKGKVVSVLKQLQTIFLEEGLSCLSSRMKCPYLLSPIPEALKADFEHCLLVSRQEQQRKNRNNHSVEVIELQEYTT